MTVVTQPVGKGSVAGFRYLPEIASFSCAVSLSSSWNQFTTTCISAELAASSVSAGEMMRKRWALGLTP